MTYGEPPLREGKRHRMCDVIVIGVGLAGLTAGLRLAQEGRRVLLLAKGVGGTHLGSGTIDVLGYGDGLTGNPRSARAGNTARDSSDRIEHPAAALPDFLAKHPDHPYSHAGLPVLAAATHWFIRALDAEGYPFVGSLGDNFLLPTAIGAVKPAALVPRSMAAGDLRAGGNFVIVGFPNLKDFYPALVTDNLAHTTWEASPDAEMLPGRQSLSARPVLLDPPGLTEEADLSLLDLARAFDRPDFRAALTAELRPLLRPGERVGFPAALGLNDSLTAWRDLETRLDAPVFEIPTLPPSIAGIRLFERLEGALRASGARLQIGFPVVEAQIGNGRCAAVVTQGAARTYTWRAKHFILATGGIASGGIVAEPDGTVRETIFGLPLVGLPGPESPRFLPGYFDRHPFNRVGLAVDDRMRPLNEDGRPALTNLYTAGATLAHAEPWREKSGDGISLITGYRAAEAILEEERKR